jgi:hypothetical protein
MDTVTSLDVHSIEDVLAGLRASERRAAYGKTPA